MNLKTAFNQVLSNNHTGDFQLESRSADGPIGGPFGVSSRSREGVDLPQVGESHIESHIFVEGVALSWTEFLVQRTSSRSALVRGAISDDVPSRDLDFFASETRQLDLYNPMKGLQPDKMAHVFTNLAIQIFGFVKCKDRGFCQILSSVNGILMALGLDSQLYEWVAAEIWSLVTGVEVSPQSLEELGEALGKDAVKFITANLTGVVEKLVKFCSAALIAPSLMRSKVHYFKNIGRALDRTRLSSFTSAALTVDGIVSMLSHCVTRGIEYLVNWSFPDEVNTMLRESRILRESVEKTLPSMDRDTRDEMLISLAAMKTRLTNKHAGADGSFTIAQALLKELEAVIRITTRVHNHAVHTMRVPAPLSVMLVGEPAIGKSELTKIIMYMIASIKRAGPNCTPYAAHEICVAPMSRYWNNMTNQTKVVIFDDVNALLKSGETSQCVAANWAEQIIQLVNNQPFYPEVAQAEAKGTVQARLDIVISTANHQNRYGNTPGMANVDAVFRRYDIIEVELKEEFKGPDGQIDFNLVAAQGDDIYAVNPWKLSYKRYNLEKARLLSNSVPTTRGIDPGLWEHIQFTYRGQSCSSEDMTLDMMRELFSQQVSSHSSNGDSIAKMDAFTQGRFFNAPAVDVAVQPQTGFVAQNEEWYLFQCHYVALNCSFWLQTLALLIFPMTSLFWIAYKVVAWKPPRWLCAVNGRCSCVHYCRHCFLSCLLQYQLLVLCWGFTVAKAAGPFATGLANLMGLDLRAIFLSVLLGNRAGGVLSSLPLDQFRSVSAHIRRRYVSSISALADEEKRAKLQRVLLRGVFAGFTLGALLKCAKMFLQCSRISKIAQEFDKRVDPQTTVDSSGNITVECDPKVNAVPRQVTFKGTYATLPRTAQRKSEPCQTVEDSIFHAGRCIYRITIRPCTGSQLKSMVYSQYKSVMHVCAYDYYGHGTYMLTVAHAFARDFTHFSVRVHDSSRETNEYILCKDDIMFAPKTSVGGCKHDLDLCMFELPHSVTGSLPVMKKLVAEASSHNGETLTRLIPGHDDKNNVNAIDIEYGDFMGCKSHVYSVNTPAAAMLPSPISYWITGYGDEGLCGALVMSGGVVVAMHTGGHNASERVTACPINRDLLTSMKARLAGRCVGTVGKYRLDDYVVRAPYLEEYDSTKLEISPNVSVRVPGALESALHNCSYEFVAGCLGLMQEAVGSSAGLTKPPRRRRSCFRATVDSFCFAVPGNRGTVQAPING